jgi:hypothetical protein
MTDNKADRYDGSHGSPLLVFFTKRRTVLMVSLKTFTLCFRAAAWFKKDTNWKNKNVTALNQASIDVRKE